MNEQIKKDRLKKALANLVFAHCPSCDGWNCYNHGMSSEQEDEQLLDRCANAILEEVELWSKEQNPCQQSG